MAHIKKLIMIDRYNNHPSTTFCLITVLARCWPFFILDKPTWIFATVHEFTRL